MISCPGCGLDLSDKPWLRQIIETNKRMSLELETLSSVTEAINRDCESLRQRLVQADQVINDLMTRGETDD